MKKEFLFSLHHMMNYFVIKFHIKEMSLKERTQICTKTLEKNRRKHERDLCGSLGEDRALSARLSASLCYHGHLKMLSVLYIFLSMICYKKG